MKGFPATYNPLLIRTDFSHDLEWTDLRAAMARPWGEPELDHTLTCVSDPDYSGMTIARLVELTGRDEELAVAFIADEVTLTEPDNPILAVDLCEEPGRSFRVIPSEIVPVSAHLWFANVGFSEFADSLDEAGVFRGYHSVCQAQGPR